jgi:amino acid adenylation domain-containing protein
MNGVNVSFLEVNQRANRLAHRLIAEKINVGDHVGILLPRSIDLIVAVFAILKAGGIYVPLNPEYPTQYLTDIVNDSGVKCVITDDILSSKLFTDQVCLISLSTWQSQATEFSDENPNLSISSKQNAYIIYTSGTTGRPKGVLVKHYSVINLVKGLQTSILQQYPQPLRLSLNAPLSFDVSVKQITQLLNGHSIAIIPENIRYDGEDLLNYLATHQVNIFDCTPSHFKILMAAGLVSRTDLAIRAFFLGGEAIDNSLWTKLIHETKFDFYNGYGPTECTVTTTKTKIDHNVSIPVLGRPIPNAQVYILDDYLKPVPIGVIGEIYIGGAGVATGYLNRSKLTEEKFLPHPYSSDIKSKLYKTGDLGSFTKEGIIRFHGRNDQQVKVSGYRIELGEIEHTLRSHNKIKDCFVHIVDINHQKQIVAYLVFNPDNKIDLKEVKQYLRKCLPAYMVPSFIIPINEIPLTQHGKINLKQLPNPEQYIKESVSNKTIPLMGEIEEKIAQVWKNALRIEKVNLEDNFFEIGGYSLLLYQVRRRLESTLKVRFSTIELFENPTIRSLSERVQQKMKGEGLTRKIGEQSSEELKVDRKIKDCGEHAIIAVHRYNGFYKADEQNKTEFKDDRFKKRKRAIERKKNKELMKKK